MYEAKVVAHDPDKQPIADVLSALLNYTLNNDVIVRGADNDFIGNGDLFSDKNGEEA